MTDPRSYKLNHTMLRVKDPHDSIRFYQFLGMRLIKKLAFDPTFTLYFLGYDTPTSSPDWTNRQGLLELTHNHGTEDNPLYAVHNGNSRPFGFGHIAISVDNLAGAIARLDEAGYQFVLAPRADGFEDIPFVLDPDGYWVELVGQKTGRPSEIPPSVMSSVLPPSSDLPVPVIPAPLPPITPSRASTKPVFSVEEITMPATDTRTYRFNHTMLRVKDIDKSLAFYRDVCGMDLFRTISFRPNSKGKGGMMLYFLGYADREPARHSAGPMVTPSSTVTTPSISSGGGTILASAASSPPVSTVSTAPTSAPSAESGLSAWTDEDQQFILARREGLLELRWDIGSEMDTRLTYHNGNDQPQGFGHLCLTVDNLDAACARFEQLNVSFKKRLTDGRMRDVAFILDPDGYWIEVVQNETIMRRTTW